MNKKEIIELYCINKQQVDILCSGMCYVSSQLELDDESFPLQSLKNLKLAATSFILPTVHQLGGLIESRAKLSPISYLLNKKHNSWLTVLDRPPIF